MLEIEWNEELLRWAKIVIGAKALKLARAFRLQRADYEDAKSRMWADLVTRALLYDPALGTPHGFIGGVVHNEYCELAWSFHHGEDARWRNKRRDFQEGRYYDDDAAARKMDALMSDPSRADLAVCRRSHEDELFDRMEVARLLCGAGADLIGLAEEIASSSIHGIARSRGVSRRQIRRRLHSLRDSKRNRP